MARIEPIIVYRFQIRDKEHELSKLDRIGVLLGDGNIGDLTPHEILSIEGLAETPNPLQELKTQRDSKFKETFRPDEIVTLAPVSGGMPLWAAGVTFHNSMFEREAESKQSNLYRKVYDALRPELFVKANPEEVVNPGEPIGIRSDSEWNVPEPELVLIFNSKGQLVAMTCGNDVSSRSIEGENALYLPQAKIYDSSCAIGPCAVFGLTEEDARQFETRLEVVRAGQTVVDMKGTIGDMKRTFTDLRNYLFRQKSFPHGVALFTGTNLVPQKFTLHKDDVVKISISRIGTLENPVKVIQPRELPSLEIVQN